MYQFESSLSLREDLVIRKHGLWGGEFQTADQAQYGRESYRIRKRLIIGDYHPGTGGEPNHVRTHVDEDEVVLGVIQFL